MPEASLKLYNSSYWHSWAVFLLEMLVVAAMASEQRRPWGDRHAYEKVVPVSQHYGPTFPGHMTDMAPPWRCCCQLSKPQCTQHWSFPLTCQQLHCCSPSVPPALVMHLIYHTADCGSSMAPWQEARLERINIFGSGMGPLKTAKASEPWVWDQFSISIVGQCFSYRTFFAYMYAS